MFINPVTETHKSQSLIDQILLGISQELHYLQQSIQSNALATKKLIYQLNNYFEELRSLYPDDHRIDDLRSQLISHNDESMDTGVHLLSIVEHLRQCSDFSASRQTVVLLQSVLENVVSTHRFLLEQVASLEIDIDTRSNSEIYGHQLQLEQALSHLFMHIYQNLVGHLTAGTKTPFVLKVKESVQDKQVLITIRDNFSEIFPKNEDMNIPLSSLRTPGVKERLNMSMAKTIIERHHGVLEEKSEEGFAHYFTITFNK